MTPRCRIDSLHSSFPTRARSCSGGLLLDIVDICRTSHLSLSIIARTSSASTAYTLDGLVLLERIFRHTADARRVEVGLLGLNAPQAAELFTNEH